jgi:hypothetical protein
VVFFRGKIIYHEFMENLSSRNPISFDLPSSHQISVEGKIDPTWSDRLEGMTICQDIVENSSTITTLEGELSDQALNTLYELHLPVISVMRQKIEKVNVEIVSVPLSRSISCSPK